MTRRPAVSIRRIHAEPADEPTVPTAPAAVAWLALWPDGAVERYDSALALLREVQRRDRRDAARAERRGAPAIVTTIITWNHTPEGFVPPSEDLS